MTTKIIAKIEEMQRARISKGWSCARLGRESGVTAQSISRIEKGENAGPATAKKISDALGLPVNDLFKIEQKSKGKEE